MNTTCLKHGRVHVASAALAPDEERNRAHERKRERERERERSETRNTSRGGFDTMFLAVYRFFTEGRLVANLKLVENNTAIRSKAKA